MLASSIQLHARFLVTFKTSLQVIFSFIILLRNLSFFLKILISGLGLSQAVVYEQTVILNQKLKWLILNV